MQRALFLFLFLVLSLSVFATETENLGIRVLPTPSKMVIDGKTNDWDLSGGVFVCGDVENLRDKIGCWIYTMYDQDNLYVLTKWVDETPMNNPGSVTGDMGFQGDCLQLRIVCNPEDTKNPAICWLTAWRDRDGKDVVNIDFYKYDGEKLRDAKTKGAEQAFLKNADGKGYVQEMKLPWKVLIKDGITPVPGKKIILSAEPNFSTDAKFRITLKDLFRPGVTPDRVFTFRAINCWGFATFMDKGNVEPQPLRLTDNREFPVKVSKGETVIDWNGLYESQKMEGFVNIPLNMPEDGYVSLNIKNGDGQVVRQLLSAAFLTKGKHEIPWDGLTNLNHKQPGVVVPAGNYSWEAIYHKDINMQLVGWAHNGGRAPYESTGGNWGGDQGNPIAVDTDGTSMYLGWSGAEAGRALVATDLDGNVRWRHKRGGFGNARLVAVDGGIVYIYDRQQGDNVIYRLNANKGDYSSWKGTDDATLNITKLLNADTPPILNGMFAVNRKLIVSTGDTVAVIDDSTGTLIRQIAVPGASDLEVGKDGKLYVVSMKSKVLKVDLDVDKVETIVDGLTNASGLALDADGQIYVGVGDPDNQVKVFGVDGKPVRTIGKTSGRALFGPWEQDGMHFVQGLRIDAQGKLWVMENDSHPRRISVWDAKTGKFVKEFFGPTDYGAQGGAISPLDPYTMVGHGCEWKLDKATGRASCVGVFHRGGMMNARFGIGTNGRLYLAIGDDAHKTNPVYIYERISAGNWKLRTSFTAINDARNKLIGAKVWSDINDDQLVQDEEVKTYNIELNGWITGWYMPMTQSLIFYGGVYRIAVTGYTACGAPLYDLSLAKKMPAPDDINIRGGMGAQRGSGSEDGKLAIYNGRYGANNSDFVCYDIESGKQVWSYPNTYVGVHGGHQAPPKQTGLIRAAYDIVGTAKLPDPIGDIFVIATDKGEWHILTGEGYYLTSLFESDPMKIKWPDQAVPGAMMNNTPPGMGAEDFGGSMIYTKDGQLYIQAGKTAFVNIKVNGLDTVKKLDKGTLTVTPENLVQANAFREKLLQQVVGNKQETVKKLTVAFTGDIRKDFADNNTMKFAKSPSAGVEATISYDDNNLYLGWQVNDDSPWVNGATEPAVMYALGDTVDFQIGTDPKADKKRTEAVMGDLRLSIGYFQGKSTAVVYRRVSSEKDKAPRKFYSGVVKSGYQMDSVKVLDSAKINVKIDAKRKMYTVEAAIPLADIGLTPAPGLKLYGDFGATHGDQAGTDTILRTYWNNQFTGLVADEVFELKMEPNHWGILNFE
ncbi:MAG: PQQ-binding-like beta-propeller repeat protein [bacterium]